MVDKFTLSSIKIFVTTQLRQHSNVQHIQLNILSQQCTGQVEVKNNVVIYILSNQIIVCNSEVLKSRNLTNEERVLCSEV